MKISYNWLRWYIPEIPKAEKLRDIFTYHLCEVENIEKKEDDTVFDINILPNRAHDLLSHLGIARELASFLNIEFKDPTPMYKVPEISSRLDLGGSEGSISSRLQIKIKTDKCRRYIGRIVRNVKIEPSPDWVQKHLESIGQRSINNIVDATNLVMYDSGQPCHAFDLDKLANGILIIRQAKEGENLTTLDGKEVKLFSTDMVITDEKNILAIAGVKGGKFAEIDESTRNILIEVANFDPISVRKTSKRTGILTDSSKRFENDLSPEVAFYAMREISGLLVEYGECKFEEIIDIYPNKQKSRELSFSADKISKILGMVLSETEIENILKRYNFEYKKSSHDKGDAGGLFEIVVPPTRFDLEIEEDMAEEIGRILGYDKVKPKIPKINFKPKINNTYAKICWVRNKLLSEGYSEVMTYSFCDKGEVEVLASASDKNFLRTGLSDGLKESLKLNQLNAPLLQMKDIKIFEIGTVFLKDKEEIHIAYGDKKEIKEIELKKFVSEKLSPEEHGYFSAEKFLVLAPSRSQVSSEETFHSQIFKMWSMYPFITRDIAVWVPENISSSEVEKVIKNNAGELVIRGPELFDQFKKGNQISYAFKLVFQSYERTLTDDEVNEIMTKIGHKISENSSWQIR